MNNYTKNEFQTENWNQIYNKFQPYINKTNAKQLNVQMNGNTAYSNYPVEEIRPATKILRHLMDNGIGYKVQVSPYGVQAVLDNSQYKVTLLTNQNKSNTLNVGNVFINSGAAYMLTNSNNRRGAKIPNTFVNRYNKKDNKMYSVFNPNSKEAQAKVEHPAELLDIVLGKSKGIKISSHTSARLKERRGKQDEPAGTTKTYMNDNNTGVTYVSSPNVSNKLNFSRTGILREMAPKGMTYPQLERMYFEKVFSPAKKSSNLVVQSTKNWMNNYIRQHSNLNAKGPQTIGNYLNRVYQAYDARLKVGKFQRIITDLTNHGTNFVDPIYQYNNSKNNKKIKLNDTQKKYNKYYQNAINKSNFDAAGDMFNDTRLMRLQKSQANRPNNSRRSYRPSIGLRRLMAAARYQEAHHTDNIVVRDKHSGNYQVSSIKANLPQLLQNARIDDDIDDPQTGLSVNQKQLLRGTARQIDNQLDKGMSKSYIKQSISRAKAYYVAKIFGDAQSKGTLVANSQNNLKANSNYSDENADKIHGIMADYIENNKDSLSFQDMIKNLSTKGNDLNSQQKLLINESIKQANEYVGSYDKGFDPNAVINLLSESYGGHVRNYMYVALTTNKYPRKKYLINGENSIVRAAENDHNNVLDKIEDHSADYNPANRVSIQNESNRYLKNAMTTVQKSLISHGIRGGRQYGSQTRPQVYIDSKSGVVKWYGYRTYYYKSSKHPAETRPISGKIGQFFAPDKNGLLHTNFASHDNLTKIPGYKGYYVHNDWPVIDDHNQKSDNYKGNFDFSKLHANPPTLTNTVTGRVYHPTTRRQRIRAIGFSQMMNRRINYLVTNQVYRQPPISDVSKSAKNPLINGDVSSPRDTVIMDGLYHSELYGRNLSGMKAHFFELSDRSKADKKAIIDDERTCVHFDKDIVNAPEGMLQGPDFHDENPRVVGTHEMAGLSDPRESGNGPSQGVNIHLAKGSKVNADNTITPAKSIKEIHREMYALADAQIANAKKQKNGVHKLLMKVNNLVTPPSGMHLASDGRAYHIFGGDANHNAFRLGAGKVIEVNNQNSSKLVYQMGLRDALAQVNALDTIGKNKDGSYNYVIPRSPLRSRPQFRYDRYNMADRSLMSAHYAQSAPHSKRARVSLVSLGGFTFDDSATVSKSFAIRNPHIEADDENGSKFQKGLRQYYTNKILNQNPTLKHTLGNVTDVGTLVHNRANYSGNLAAQIKRVLDTSDDMTNIALDKANYNSQKNGISFTSNEINKYKKIALTNLIQNQLKQKGQPNYRAAAENEAQMRANNGQLDIGLADYGQPAWSKEISDVINNYIKFANVDKIKSDNKLTTFVFDDNKDKKYANDNKPRYLVHPFGAEGTDNINNVDPNRMDEVGFKQVAGPNGEPENIRLRPLRKGDKIIDYAGNKATLGAVLNPKMPDKYAKKYGILNEVQVARLNPDVDVYMNPFSVVSRDNTGLIKNMHENAKNNPNDKVEFVKTRNPKTGKIENKAQSGVMEIMTTDIPVDTKTQTYDNKKFAQGRGRSLNGQIGWVLQAFHANNILHEFYKNNDSQWRHYRNYLNSVGFDIVKDPKTGKMKYTTIDTNLGYRPHTGLGKDGKGVEKRQVYTADSSNDGAVDKASGVKELYPGDPNEFTRLMSGRSGVLKLPFKISLNPILTNKYNKPIRTNKLAIMDSSMRRNMRNADNTISLNDYMTFYKNIYSGVQKYYQDEENYKTLKADGTKTNQIKNYAAKLGLIKGNGPTDQDLVQNNVNKLQNQVISRELGGLDGSEQKFSFPRRNLIEKRTRHSSTAVVTADARVPLGHVKVGRKVYDNMFSPKVRSQVSNLKKNVNSSKGAAKKTAQKKLHDYQKLHSRVLMWRDPALTEGSVRSVVVDEDPSIDGVGAGMPPLADNSFEGDFDGDTYGLVPIPEKDVTKPSIQHELDKMSMKQNLLNNFGKSPASYLNMSMDAVNAAVNGGYVPKTYYQTYKPKYIGTGNNKHLNKSGTQKWLTNGVYYDYLDKMQKGNHALKSNPKLKAFYDYVKKNYVDKYPNGSKKLDAFMQKPAAFVKRPNNSKRGYHLVMPIQDKNYATSSKDVGKPMGTSKDMLTHMLVKIGSNPKEDVNTRFKKTQKLLTHIMRKDDFASAYVDIESKRHVKAALAGKHVKLSPDEDLKATIKSIQNSCDTGAKGNPPKRMNRFKKFYEGCAVRTDLQDVQFAKGVQSALTGVAGSYSQAMFSLFRHYNPDMAIEITHPDTQAVLQIKHNPTQAKKFKGLLNNQMKQVLAQGRPLMKTKGRDGKYHYPTDDKGNPELKVDFRRNHIQTPEGFKSDYHQILKQLGISVNPKLLNNLTKGLTLDAKDPNGNIHNIVLGTQQSLVLDKSVGGTSSVLDQSMYGRHKTMLPKSVKLPSKQAEKLGHSRAIKLNNFQPSAYKNNSILDASHNPFEVDYESKQDILSKVKGISKAAKAPTKSYAARLDTGGLAAITRAVEFPHYDSSIGTDDYLSDTQKGLQQESYDKDAQAQPDNVVTQTGIKQQSSQASNQTGISATADSLARYKAIKARQVNSMNAANSHPDSNKDNYKATSHNAFVEAAKSENQADKPAKPSIDTMHKSDNIDRTKNNSKDPKGPKGPDNSDGPEM